MHQRPGEILHWLLSSARPQWVSHKQETQTPNLPRAHIGRSVYYCLKRQHIYLLDGVKDRVILRAPKPIAMITLQQGPSFRWASQRNQEIRRIVVQADSLYAPYFISDWMSITCSLACWDRGEGGENDTWITFCSTGLKGICIPCQS